MGGVASHPLRVRLRRAGILLAAALVLGACGDAGPVPIATPTTSAPSAGAPAPTTSVAMTAAAGATSPLAALIEPVGSMIYAPPTSVAKPHPVRLGVPSIGVRDATVVAVGVDAAGELAVPGAREVGWYRFAARPGEAGSVVLAAHVAFDGVDGIFRRLGDLDDGAAVTVGLDDGTTLAFVVESVERIDKDELPADLFSTVGPSRLVLITCGGAFDRVRRSYEDNIIAIARPA